MTGLKIIASFLTYFSIGAVIGGIMRGLINEYSKYYMDPECYIVGWIIILPILLSGFIFEELTKISETIRKMIVKRINGEEDEDN